MLILSNKTEYKSIKIISTIVGFIQYKLT